MDIEEKQLKKPHDAFFRWLFADTNHLKFLLELAGNDLFKPKLQKLPSNELSCLLEKISLYF